MARNGSARMRGSRSFTNLTVAIRRGGGRALLLESDHKAVLSSESQAAGPRRSVAELSATIISPAAGLLVERSAFVFSGSQLARGAPASNRPAAGWASCVSFIAPLTPTRSSVPPGSILSHTTVWSPP